MASAGATHCVLRTESPSETDRKGVSHMQQTRYNFLCCQSGGWDTPSPPGLCVAKTNKVAESMNNPWPAPHPSRWQGGAPKKDSRTLCKATALE